MAKKGQVFTKTENGAKWADNAGGGAGGGDPFVITFATSDMQTVTTDKTFAKLQNAVKAEQRIVAKLNLAGANIYVYVAEFMENNYVLFTNVVKGDDTSATVVVIEFNGDTNKVSLKYNMLPYS